MKFCADTKESRITSLKVPGISVNEKTDLHI